MRASYHNGGGATLSLSGLNVSSVRLLERMAPGNVIRRCEGKALGDVLIQSVSAQQSSSASMSIITDVAALHKRKGHPIFFFQKLMESSRSYRFIKDLFVCRLAN